MRPLILSIIILFQSCNGCHNTKIEEAGKQYQNPKIQDSIRKEVQKMEDQKQEVNTSEVNVQEILKGYWILWQIRNESDSILNHSGPVVSKSIEFKADSITVYNRGKQYKGTWKYNNNYLNIKINGTNQFDYILSKITYDLLCLHLKNNRTSDCFIKLDFSKMVY